MREDDREEEERVGRVDGGENTREIIQAVNFYTPNALQIAHFCSRNQDQTLVA